MPPISTARLLSIERYINNQKDLHPGATGTFTGLMHDLTFAMRLIAKEVRRAGLNDILGMTENVNVHGEQVRKVDKYANEAIIKSMSLNGDICAMASEESIELIKIPENRKKGKYVLLFDPIDGSTNIDVNVTIGTIFSLYKRLDTNSVADGTIEDLLQPGYKQVAAGYLLYGSSTMFVYTTGAGVNVFTYDPTIGEFLLTYDKVKIPEIGSQYSCNEGNSWQWNDNVKKFVEYIKRGNGNDRKPYSLRYIGTSVADIHRMLHYGGIYMYPTDLNYPEGKIRLIYEANPLAMIVEQAGGLALDGKNRLLDLKPEAIHQRVPFYLGSKRDVTELTQFLDGTHPYLRS